MFHLDVLIISELRMKSTDQIWYTLVLLRKNRGEGLQK